MRQRMSFADGSGMLRGAARVPDIARERPDAYKDEWSGWPRNWLASEGPEHNLGHTHIVGPSPRRKSSRRCGRFSLLLRLMPTALDMSSLERPCGVCRTTSLDSRRPWGPDPRSLYTNLSRHKQSSGSMESRVYAAAETLKPHVSRLRAPQGLREGSPQGPREGIKRGPRELLKGPREGTPSGGFGKAPNRPKIAPKQQQQISKPL